MSWASKLKAAEVEAEVAMKSPDPWVTRLTRLRGKESGDGIERIGTQSVFDVLEIPQRHRGSGACKRLARTMKSLGWSPIKSRGLNQAGFRDQIRGYAKDNWGSPLSETTIGTGSASEQRMKVAAAM
jgi:hypothetical protein